MKYYLNFVKNIVIWNVFLLHLILQLSIIATFGVDAGLVRQRNICGFAQCKEVKKFYYKAGVVYSYQYTVNGTTSIAGGPNGEAGLHLSSKVAIKFLTACDAILSMKDVQVWQSHIPSGSEGSMKDSHFTRRDSEEIFSKALQEFTLRFSYADGIIAEICPDPRESVWMLNVKRGLLSAFQNTMRRLDLEHKGDEDDIHGRCKVEYKLGLATSSILTIERTKDIGSCGDKFGILSSVQGTPYHFGTLHQSMPAVSSTSDCQHVVDRNLLAGIRCSETHRLQSLARGVAGAQTKIYQILDLISIYDPFNSNGTESQSQKTEDDDETLPSVSRSLDRVFAYLIPATSMNVGRRESLQFRHDYHLPRKPNDHQIAKNVLKDFCASLKDDVGSGSGDAFETLVGVLRGLNLTDMMSLSAEATDICQGDRTPFDDALEAVGTAVAVHVMKEQILKGEAPPDTINAWISSLTYIPKPDLVLMTTAVDILRERDKYPQILLTYSTLAHSYCRSKPDCSAHRPIDILNRLYKKFFLHTNCLAKKTKDIEQTLMYLKGIGNFGFYSPGIKDALWKCIQRNDATEIRVAAIEAYRRMDCSPDVSILKNVFENQLEDSEVRIASFLGLMRCPTYDTIKLIKTILDNEEVNQVGTFVWSYLKNLQETALPSKAELQGLVSDEKFTKKFSTDFRKFSRNLEISTFYDDFNFGIGLESNWIFSQKSYVPRSAMLNLTVDLFGESINVFEATLRLENFEHYIESLFGPNGKFRSKELHSIISSFREKRATPNKRRLKQLTLDFDALRRYHSDPIASVSLKTFGNEILFKRSVGSHEHSNFFNSLNPFEYLKTLADQNSKWQKSKMFLDSTYIIPTGIGFPLNLTAQASAIIKMDTESEFTFDDTELKVKGKLKPSAIIAVSGSMILGTIELQTGIKIKAHLRSSTAIEGIFQTKGKEMIQTEFGLPKSQLELLEYKSELMFMQGNEFHVVGRFLPKSPLCTNGLFEEIFGLKLCRSSYFNLSPNSDVDDGTSPYFPLNGPAYLTLTLEKANPSLLNTKLSYVSNNNESNTRLEATYGITTTQGLKSLGLTFDLDKTNQNFALGIMLPRNQLTLSGSLRKDHSSGEVKLTAISNNVQALNTMISFVKTETGNGEALLKPEILIKLCNRRILDANGEVRVEKKGDGLSFDGTGVVRLEEGSTSVNVRLNGVHNESRLTLVWDGDYQTGEDVSNTKTIKWKSTIRKEAPKRHDELWKEIDTTLSLQFSEFPDYNLEASWKYKKGEEKVDSEGEFSMGKGPSWSDQTTLRIRHKFEWEENYNATNTIWLFQISQPRQRSEWGFGGTLNTHGKSMNSTINLQYAPEKKLETSLALIREAGVLTVFGIGWTIQLTNQLPLKIEFHLQETAHRVYEGKFEGDWFGKNTLQVGMNFVDRTRRQKLDKELKMSIELGRTVSELLKLTSHIYSDEKESKLRLSSEYKNRNHSLEMGHTNESKGSKRHQVYLSVKDNGTEYLVTIESEIDENGLEVSIETNLNAQLADIYGRFKVTKVSGLYTIGCDYKWDASRDSSKSFHFLTLLDLSELNYPKYKLSLTHPGTAFLISAEQKKDSNENRAVKGRISWSEAEEIFFNGNLRHISGNVYEISYDAQTPFTNIKNTSLKIGLNCVQRGNCLIHIDGLWGKKEKISGVISTKFELLPMVTIVETKSLLENEEEEESDYGDTDEGVDEDGSSHHHHGRHRRHDVVTDMKGSKVIQTTQHQGYILSFNSNLTSTVEQWKVLRISMQHTIHDPFHLKTDIDVQLPEAKELNFSIQWDLPRTLKEIWSTRIHCQVKTPFPNYQTFDLQAVLGQKEDADTLATFGIYTDHSQYSMTITGTPKFDKDGSIGFDMITSVPNYDKIFGSLSYEIGENSRLACQLGWPKVVIGLETGFEWSGSWEEFQIFYTFNSPWEPLKNINTLLKIDGTQAELKFLLNDEGVTAKSEWVVENINNFDIRFDATSPLPDWKQIGLIAKHSFEESEEYYSQIAAWVNNAQLGYKLEGGESEIEEEDAVAKIINSQIEIDTLIYPTVRTTMSLRQKEANFNLGMSLLLREGPINVSVELHLLDLFRFNEKIRITTPYPGLFELEINLTPAIIPESNLYNIEFRTRWRPSTSSWEEAGLYVRIGDQRSLADALTSDLADSVVYEDEDENEEEKGQEIRKVKRVIVPMSQLFYFHSPFKWVRVIKMEIEKTTGDTNTDPTESSLEETEDAKDDGSKKEDELEKVRTENEIQFPLKMFVVLFNGDSANLNVHIQNEIGEKTLSAQISLPEIQNPISLKFESKLELTSPEKKFTVHATNYLPNLQEIQMESTFQKEKNFLNGRIDVETPFLKWEQQHASIMYAYNEEEEMDTLDIELSSEEYGKVASNVVRSPLSIGLVLNTPIEGYPSVEFEASSAVSEEADNKYDTTIVTNIGEKEILRMEMESTIENHIPTLIKGTITTALRGYEQGNLEAMMRETEDEVNANGQIDWRNEKLTLSLSLKVLEKIFQELELKVNAPFRGYEKWKVWIKVPEEEDEGSVEESEEREDDVDEDHIMNFLYNVETPWAEFSPINGKANIKMGSSMLVIKRLALSGIAPKGSFNIMTSWILSDWNSFEVHCDSKYSHKLERNNKFPLLQVLSKSNFLKFKIRNFIPTFERIQLLDTMVYYEMENPPIRFGTTAFINLKDGETPSVQLLTIQLSSRLPNVTHAIDLTSTFDKEINSIDSKLIYTLSPPTETFISTLLIKRVKGSLEGDGVFEWGSSKFSSIQSKFNCTYSSISDLNFEVKFFHPKAENSKKVIGSIDGSFDNVSGRHKVRLERIERDEDVEPLLVDLDMSYRWNELLTSVNSVLLLTSTYPRIPSSGFHFNGSLEDGYHARVGGFIKNQNASILFDWLLQDLANGTVNANGTFGFEIPFTKLQSGLFGCHYKIQEKIINGEFQMILDNVKHIDSTYNYEMSMTPGEKHFTQIHIANQFWPFGITRTYHHEYVPGFSGFGSQTKTVRLVEVYDLVHQDLHKLGGELRIHTNFNGHEITLTGLHPMRNISLNTKYENLNEELKQTMTFKWAPDSYMGYEFLLKNMTTELKKEKKMEVKVNYPIRNITLNMGYTIEGTNGQLITELDLNTTAQDKKIITILNWDTHETPLMTLRKVSGIIKHPSLAQDIRGGGEIRITKGESFEGKLSLDYSGDPKRRVTYHMKVIPVIEELYYWNLTMDMRLQHLVTNLDLKAFHSNRHLPHELSIITLIDFKNTGKLSRKSKITFELFKQLKKLHLMLGNPDEEFEMLCHFQDRQPIYYFFAETNITGLNPSPKAEMILDMSQPYFKMTAVHGKDGSDGLYSEGGVIDSRNFKFDISESYDNFRTSDLNFFLRMNHSRLVTSKLIWRPEILHELQASYVNRIENLREIWNQQTDKLLFTLSTDSTEILDQIWENAKTTIEPFIEEISKNLDFGKDSEAFFQYFEDGLERNDFYMQDITGLAQLFADQVSLRFSNVFINVREYRRQILGDTSTSELFEKTLLWILEKVKVQYRTIVQLWGNYKPSTTAFTPTFSLPFPQISTKVSYFLNQCLESVIKATDLAIGSVSSLTNSIGSFIGEKLQQHRPGISAIVHKMERVVYQFLVYVSDFIYERRDEVMKSPYYIKMAQLAEDVDQLYKDLIENDISSNMKKYYAMFLNFLQEKTNFDELNLHFAKVGLFLDELLGKIKNLDSVKEFQSSMNELCQTMKWLSEYTHFSELVYQLIFTLYEKGPELMSQTVLEANAKYEQAKTKFIFDADKGIMEWEQKLPIPWNAFNTPPVFSELPEYKGSVYLKEFFDSSGGSFLETFYHTPKYSEIGWFPPFDGHAMIAGSEYYFTFDGRFYNFTGPCVYLLVGDLVEVNFTISIENKGFREGIPEYNIIITSSHNTLYIDFESKTLRDPKRPQNVGLPIQMQHLQGYQDGGYLVVESPKAEFSVVCNMVYRLCQFKVSGWHSRKIGGLLGTMDHEPTTDLIHSNGKVGPDINDMAKSWDVSDDSLEPSATCTSSVTNTSDSPRTSNETKTNQNYKLSSTCNKLFTHRLSSLQPCYNSVKIDLYLEMCLNGRESSDDYPACLSAMAYIKMCERSGVQVQMPSVCVKCDLNGETMMDYDVKIMGFATSSPRSADIVFIVEAKDCNKNLRMRRRMETLVAALETELKKTKFTNNKYAVVTFGGDGVYEKPRSILVNGELFTEFGKLGLHFNHIHTTNQEGKSRDVFGGIAHALKLKFRPGASKTFILLPCTTCQPEDMTMDFSTIHYAMLEQSVSLHVLMHKDLEFVDKKLGKKFFGMDNDVAFTKADAEKVGPLQGNSILRRQVKLSKSTLGYCAPLALQTNGTIFNGNKLQNKREQIVNIFSRLFSRRLALAAEPQHCHSCYCFSGDDGVGRVNCYRCDYQRPGQYNPEMDLENETGEVNYSLKNIKGSSTLEDKADGEEDEDESEENQNIDEDQTGDDDEYLNEGGPRGR